MDVMSSFADNEFCDDADLDAHMCQLSQKRAECEALEDPSARRACMPDLDGEFETEQAHARDQLQAAETAARNAREKGAAAHGKQLRSETAVSETEAACAVQSQTLATAEATEEKGERKLEDMRAIRTTLEEQLAEKEAAVTRARARLAEHMCRQTAAEQHHAKRKEDVRAIRDTARDMEERLGEYRRAVQYHRTHVDEARAAETAADSHVSEAWREFGMGEWIPGVNYTCVALTELREARDQDSPAAGWVEAGTQFWADACGLSHDGKSVLLRLDGRGWVNAHGAGLNFSYHFFF